MCIDELESSMLSRLCWIVALSSLAGCASGSKVYKFPNDLDLTLVCADRNTIDEMCRNKKGPTISDKGEVIPKTGMTKPDQHGLTKVFRVYIPGCASHGDRKLYMPDGPFCQLLSHEFCHLDGVYTDKECAELYPGRRLTSTGSVLSNKKENNNEKWNYCVSLRNCLTSIGCFGSGGVYP